MGKKTIALLLLAVLAVTALCAAHGYVDRASDRVVLREEILSGDKAAAQGVTAELHSVLGQQLFWDTTYTVGGDTHTDFAFYPSRQYRIGDSEPNGVVLNLNFDPPALDGDDDPFTAAMDKPFAELRAETPAGQEGRKRICLKDYMEFLPLEVWVETRGTHFHWGKWMRTDSGEEYPDRKFLRPILEFFRFPVGEDDTVELHLNKGTDGQVYGWGCALDGQLGDFYTLNAVTDEACWFAFGGRPLDYSQVPGGKGVYCLPYDSLRQTLDTDHLAMVHPISEEAEVLDLRISGDGTKLLLCCREDGANTLTVLDLATMEVLQTLPLHPMGEEDWTQLLWRDGYFLSVCTVRQPQPEGVSDDIPVYIETVTVAEQGPDGLYRIGLQTDTGGADVFSQYRDQIALDWDGQRLAAACPRWNCGFELAVYGADGLQFHGQYTSSLDDANRRGTEEACGRSWDVPMTVKLP